MEKNELKQIIKEVLNESEYITGQLLVREDVEKFLKYDQGPDDDPKLAAEKIISLTEKYFRSIRNALKLAGPYLSPAIKQELIKDIRKRFDNLKV